MITIKVQCGCGQKYAFDVEPYNGRMPHTVACPVCGVDGTAAANQIIAQSMPSVPVAPPPTPVAAPRLSIPSARANSPSVAPAPAPAAPEPAAQARSAIASVIRAAARDEDETDNDKWKWWYYILAGICIGGYDIWMVYDTGRIKYLNGLFLAVLCIAIGIWDFKRKRKSG
jgi:hypothetical protein